MPDVSPTKWHLAHTTWFFETFLLGPHLQGYAPFDPAFHYLFNSYYEAEGPRHPRPERGLVTRPVVDAGAGLSGPRRRRRWRGCWSRRRATSASASHALVELGLNHEQQHQELILMDIKHVFSRNPLKPAYRPAPSAPGRRGAAARLARLPGGPAPDRPRRARASPSTTRARATASTSRPSSSPTGWSPAASTWPSSTTAATAGPSCGCPTAGPRCRRTAGPAPLYWRTATAGWTGLHPARRAAARSRRAGLPPQLLRGRRLRPLGRRAPADRGGVGDGRRIVRLRPGRRRAASGARRGRPGPAPDDRRALAVDRQRLPALSALQAGGRRGRRVQRQVHVGPDGAAGLAPPSPRRATPGSPTATSFRRRRAGRSAGCALRGTLDHGRRNHAAELPRPGARPGELRRRHAGGAVERAEGRSRPSSSTTRRARTCSARSPGCRSTTRPAPRSASWSGARRRWPPPSAPTRG